MPRRNIALLVTIAVISLGCYLKVSYYGRILVFVMDQIEARALVEVDRTALAEGAIEGMTRKLDENSSYYPPKEYTELSAELDQEFGGIGVQVVVDEQTRELTVVSPLYGTPAQKAGIRAGDRIVRIDGTGTQGLSVEDAKDRMRGKPGEPVVLTIQRPGQPEPFDVEIVRAVIQVDNVVGDSRDAAGAWNFFLAGHDEIGYIRVLSFGAQTVNELRRAMDKLTSAGVKGLVLDLRNDPGGLLEAAQGVCDMFLSKGQIIVTTRDRNGRIKEQFEASGQKTYGGFPVAVLVNGYSASASEIVAACLQDHEVAVIVGERTYGKGTVQQILKLDGNLGALKLTTSSYWRPSGADINRRRERTKTGWKEAPEDEEWGVKPNPGYEVRLSDEDRIRLLNWRHRRDAGQKLEANHKPGEWDPTDLTADKQLMKALEAVEKKK